MKTLHFTIIILLAALTFSIGCNNKKADPALPETTPPVTITNVTDSTSASGDNIVQHFTCPNKCKGSGGPSEGTCPVCGTAYVHNEAFHKGTSTPEPAMKIDPVTHMAVPTQTQAQNAQGVYHFSCSKGCPGGSGAAGNCPKCGTALVHNAAFHTN